MTRLTRLVSIVFVFGLSVICACSDPNGADDTVDADRNSQSPTAHRSMTDRGPVRLIVEVDPGEARLSDEPTLSVTLDVDAALEVKMPPFLETIPGFQIRSFREDPTRVSGGRRIDRQVYRIEPDDTGEYEIPSVVVQFKDTRAEGDQEDHEVATEPLKVTVTSLFDGEAPTLADLRPPAVPVEIPVASPSRLPWYASIGAGALLLILVAWLFTRRKRPEEIAPNLTPSEQANLEFERLMREDPLARGETNTFFVEMTAIVRRYIERSTGVRAPEQTTEEFLRAMRTHASFPTDTRDQLKEFLEAADLVKFAAQVPVREEIEESFRLAQEFTGLPGTLSIKGRAA